MGSEDTLEELLGNGGGIVRCFASVEVDHLCEAIHKDCYGIVTLRRRWKVCDKVHADAGPGSFGNRERLE